MHARAASNARGGVTEKLQGLDEKGMHIKFQLKYILLRQEVLLFTFSSSLHDAQVRGREEA